MDWLGLGSDFANAGSDVLQGLRSADLDPAAFGPMEPTVRRPQLQTLDPTVLDILAPVLQEIASYHDPRRARRNTWLAPAIVGATKGYQGLRERQQKAVDVRNATEISRTAAENAASRSEAKANRDAFGTAVRSQTQDGVLKTRRQIVEQKQKEAADTARAVAKARVEGENEARIAKGGQPIGTTSPRPTPNQKEAKFNPNTWKVFGDADELTLKGIDDELKSLRSDPFTAAAFRPAPKDRNGRTLSEDRRTSDARARVAELNSKRAGMTKAAILYHLQNMPTNGELYVFKQLHGLADQTGLTKDPEVDKAFDDAAEKLLPGKDK